MGKYLLFIVGLFALVLMLKFWVPQDAERIESDIRARAEQAISDNGFDWVSISVDGRNVTLSGEAPNKSAMDRAIAETRIVPGVKTVYNDLDVATSGDRLAAATSVPQASTAPSEETASDAESVDADAKTAEEKAAEEAKQLADAAAAKEAAEEAAEEAKQLADAAATKKTAEEAAAKKAAEEAKQLADAAAAKKAAEEAAAKKAAEEAKQLADAAAAKKAAEEAAAKKAAEEAKQLADATAAKKAAEEDAANKVAEKDEATPAECASAFDAALAKHSVEFEAGGGGLAPSSHGLLDELIAIAKRCPNSVVRIEGHTDASGGSRENLKLSQRRALAVFNYFTQHGIPESRLVALGCGEERPVAPNDTPEGRAQNRRIEFTLKGL